MGKRYWLAGQVNIPENKKQEFNDYVMEILNRLRHSETKGYHSGGQGSYRLGQTAARPEWDGSV